MANLGMNILAGALPAVGALVGGPVGGLAGGVGGGVGNYLQQQSNEKIGAEVGGGMPHFSKGGIATKPSIVGEDGPEAVAPLTKSPESLTEQDLQKVEQLIALLQDRIAQHRRTHGRRMYGENA